MSEHLEKSQNIFVKMFIPAKGDDKGTIIRKIVTILCIVVAIVCAVVVTIEFTRRSDDAQLIEDLAEKIELNASGSFSIDEQKVDEIKKEEPEILDKFIDLYAENNEIVGWITVGGGEQLISYPVMMNEGDTEYYLYRNFYKEDSISGSIFCDNHILPFTDANNLLIYGHNMSSGEYFAKLTYYNPYSTHKSSFLQHYKNYPTLQFDTLWEESTYKIFGGMFINVEDVDGYVYPYHRKRQFKNELEFMDFMGNIMDRSVFYTDVDVEYGDQIISLSTCYYYPTGYDVDARFVLLARKVREGEDPSVDVDKVVVNPDPLFFDAYYRVMGGSWGGRTWDKDYPWLVKDFDKYTDKIDSLGNTQA